MALRASSAPDSPTAAPLAQLILLALWLGAAAFFALAVAPSVFDVLPSRDLAGILIARLLPVLSWAGAATGVVFLGLELSRGRSLRGRSRLMASALIVLACLIVQLGIAPRIAALRASLATPLAELAANDPQRLAFGRLHMFSVAGLGVAMSAALVGLLLVAINLRSRATDDRR